MGVDYFFGRAYAIRMTTATPEPTAITPDDYRTATRNHPRRDVCRLTDPQVPGKIVAWDGAGAVLVAWGEHADLTPHFAAQHATSEQLSQLTWYTPVNDTIVVSPGTTPDTVVITMSRTAVDRLCHQIVMSDYGWTPLADVLMSWYPGGIEDTPLMRLHALLSRKP